MDNMEKLRVLLQHWIEHNAGHVEEFDKWQGIMTQEGKKEIAAKIDEAKTQMGKVSKILTDALDHAGGPADGEHHHHQHHH